MHLRGVSRYASLPALKSIITMWRHYLMHFSWKHALNNLPLRQDAGFFHHFSHLGVNFDSLERMVTPLFTLAFKILYS
jgi:hypothetical protein